MATFAGDGERAKQADEDAYIVKCTLYCWSTAEVPSAELCCVWRNKQVSNAEGIMSNPVSARLEQLGCRIG
ncbi:hypothetical protein FRX31_034795 [Thalictrum thalictroides]|uniref:Uncharacterized protein n=1 Tax=Thalictrum thalictroides TaxID=46969 RepID=A0A7J6USV1_THATH|nr:hypothetical protein FRX31_034795 [Thalictrum thalictroides]